MAMTKRPTDPNKLGKLIVDIATKSIDKDPAAVALGRKGGLVGGKARAAALTPEQRSEIARKGAEKRWKKD